MTNPKEIKKEIEQILNQIKVDFIETIHEEFHWVGNIEKCDACIAHQTKLKASLERLYQTGYQEGFDEGRMQGTTEGRLEIGEDIL